ncbi:MAG TPA: hypothetical protein VHT52_19815 [Stellaceae bacterium]|jgi:hypothetical protein|nr:hypothetical protein [Stellaceae bacterium]
MISIDLAVNAIAAGLLLGGFYAAVTVGVTISFGMLDIVNIAHPAFIMLGSFVAYIVNSSFGLDPILIGVVTAPAQGTRSLHPKISRNSADRWSMLPTATAGRPGTAPRHNCRPLRPARTRRVPGR